MVQKKIAKKGKLTGIITHSLSIDLKGNDKGAGLHSAECA